MLKEKQKHFRPIKIQNNDIDWRHAKKFGEKMKIFEENSY